MDMFTNNVLTKELLNARTYYELGVDILGFGPIATIEELSVYLSDFRRDGHRLLIW